MSVGVQVLIDTPVWSLALRRRRAQLAPADRRIVAAWGDLIRENAAAIIGPIRQELLSGLASESAFNRLRDHLRAFEDIPLGLHDYEQAARFANKCRSIGLAGSSVDFLICAAAYSHDLEIFTTDRDFARYARCLPIRVHYPQT